MNDSELDTLARAAGAALAGRGWCMATAESCTGGWIAEAVTAISGSSAWFDRGFVTYSNAAKIDMLGVSPATLTAHGAVSEATALEMVAGALERSLADIAVAVSGIAGPSGGTPDKPVGLVCLAWATRNVPARALTLRFAGDRYAVRRQTVLRALQGIVEFASPAD